MTVFAIVYAILILLSPIACLVLAWKVRGLRRRVERVERWKGWAE